MGPSVSRCQRSITVVQTSETTGLSCRWQPVFKPPIQVPPREFAETPLKAEKDLEQCDREAGIRLTLKLFGLPRIATASAPSSQVHEGVER